MRCEPQIETTTTLKGITLTLTVAEATALFRVCGHVGGGARTNGRGVTTVRKTTDTIHALLAAVLPTRDCLDPFDHKATMQHEGQPCFKSEGE